MEQEPTPKRFIFNDKIDHEFLFNLYEDDLQYLIQVFETSLESLGQELQSLYEAYEHSDLTNIKKTIHKIKPVFGFTGLLEHQNIIEEFEKNYASESNILQLKPAFDVLVSHIENGR